MIPLAYITDRVSTREFQMNLRAKQVDREFREDIRSLLRDGITFDVDAAIECIDQQFVQHLDAAWERFKLAPT